MDLTSWFNRWLLVVFIMCSLNTTQLFRVDSLSVNLMRLSSGGDIVEGDEVKLRCDVSGLAASHVIEWVRIYMNAEVTIARNGTSLDQKYEFETIREMSTSGISINENLVIKNISKTDTSFTCLINVTESEMMSGNLLLSSNTKLFVHYFPSPTICFPNGSFTVQEGKEQMLSCTSEEGYPTVSVEFLPNPSTAILMWMYSNSSNEVKGFINLTLDETHNGYQFQCTITSGYFPGRSRSCIIGPITVTNMTTTDLLTTDDGNSLQTETSTSDDMKTTFNPSSLTIAIIVGVAGAGGILLLIVITLIVLYACRCCCFNGKSRRSSLWLTDIPLDATVEDPNIDHDIDRREPKMSTSIYQNATDLTTENKPDPRMPQQSASEPSHLDTQEMSYNDDDAADVISPRKFSTHSQNNDQDSPRSPGTSSFKLTRSDVCITDKEDGEHLGTEPDEGDAPTYGVVMKSNRVSQGSKEKPPEITSDGTDPWANAPLNEHENINPASNENEYAEMSPLSDDPGHRGKPTAMVRPVSHTPKPPIATKPDRQSSRRTDTNQAPPSVANKPIKKYKPKERNPSADEFGNRDKTPLPTPPPPSPFIDQEESASAEGYGEEEGDEVPPDTQVPHEAYSADEDNVMYAELDLQSATSDAMPQPEEEQTLYASMMSK